MFGLEGHHHHSHLLLGHVHGGGARLRIDAGMDRRGVPRCWTRGSGDVMTTCPLDRGWRLWTMFHNRYDRVPSDAALDAHGVRAGAVVETLHPAWEIADDDASRMPMTTEESKDVPWRFEEGSPWHVHAEFPVGADVVHVDVCGARRSAPGSFWREARIHVNGELRGGGGGCGCSLGAGGHDEPATARVGAHVVEVSLIANPRLAAGPPLIRVLLRTIA